MMYVVVYISAKIGQVYSNDAVEQIAIDRSVQPTMQLDAPSDEAAPGRS
jgi:hypothetical protein